MSLIMFDYDGVIADSLEIHVRSFLAAFHENGFTKLNTTQDIIDLYEDNVYRSMADLGLTEAHIDRILASYKKRQDLVLDQIDFFPHMDSFLQALSLHHKIYIITSNMSDAVQKVLDHKGVTGVEQVLGSDTEKSKIKKMQKAMTLHRDLKPYYVGDTKGDIFEGRQAGACTVGVAWGWHGPDKLKESRPDYLVYTPQELRQLLDTD